MEVSREVQVSPPELEEWRRVFLETGQQGLRRRGRDPGERELNPDPGEAGRVDDATGACERTPGKKGVRGRAGEALEARTRVSPGTGRLYPLTMICEVWRVGRSTVYAARDREESDGPAGLEEARTEDEAERRGVGGGDPTGAEGERLPGRRPPEGPGPSESRGDRCGQEPRAAADAGEWAAGPRTARKAPAWGPEPQRPDHDGCAERAVGYGRDAVLHEGGWVVLVLRGGWITASQDVVGWHVAKKGDRWAALEPIRQGVRTHMDGYAPKIALGLGLRHDWGPQYTAHQFQGELAWLGIRSTASYVGEPECNGVAERFMRTLKEECLYLHDFESLEEARQEIDAFIERYNRGWLLERHGYRTPAQVRQELTLKAA